MTMSTATQQTTAILDGDRIVIRTPFSPESAAFCRSLPESRVVCQAAKSEDGLSVWRCLATPWTCKKIYERWEIRVSSSTTDVRRMTEWAFHPKIRLYPAGSQLLQPRIRKMDAWDHQCEAYHRIRCFQSYMLALDMGVGKSRCVVDLVQNVGHQAILILCPKSVIPVWRREFDRHAAIDIDVLCLDKGSSISKAAEAKKFLYSNRGVRPAVVVVNYESAIQPSLLRLFTSQLWGLVVCDESQKIKSPQGKASLCAYEIGKLAKQRLCLTGTPMPHSPMDLYSQYRFLDAGIFGTSITRFRTRYAVCDKMFPSKVNEWINQGELKEKYHSISYRVEAKDVLNLPPVAHERITIALKPETRKLYDEMRDEMIVEIAAGTVTASNALVKLKCLAQITSGFLSGNGVPDSPVGSEKADALRDLLEKLGYSFDSPTVVFCRFRHDLAVAKQVAENLGRTYGEISGPRKDALDDMGCMADGLDVVGVQMQAGSTGIDLTRANYGIYYSVNWSLGDYDQSIARLHRPGQKQHTFFYHILCEDTVDYSVYAAFDKRRKIVDAVLRDLTTEV